jgi:hypothetical protein
VNGEVVRNNYRVRGKKHLFHTYIAKWPDLRGRGGQLDNRQQKKKGLTVPTKVIISETRSWAVTHSIANFVETDSLVLQIYEKKRGL